MRKIQYLVWIFMMISAFSHAQIMEEDSVRTVGLEEVILIRKQTLDQQKQSKPLSSLDEYIEQSSKVNMVKRGNYAWEPAMNNMLSERLNVTIDGMQIFGACTDKMDPITSYVDVSNLSEIHIRSGQQGTENGAAIGGGIDLVLQKSYFDQDFWNVGVDAGYESNAHAKIFSTELNYGNTRFFINTDFLFRDADDYQAGGGEEVLYSQFQKYNFSVSTGYKVGKYGAVLGTLIYDRANDVGYPALTMDVSQAKALITSLSYRHKNPDHFVQDWETKVYFNIIEHVMDDTQRPDVPIHMDMPGWSDTYGFYLKLKSQKQAHKLLLNWNGYYNRSLAEMTMYPEDPNENLMFMLTWPDVQTFYSGVYAEDVWTLPQGQNLKLSARLGGQYENIADDFGYNSLKIFYPEMDQDQQRFLFSLNAQYEKAWKDFDLLVSSGYGERAPSVSEAYGFYLYNSFDNFDYIGNPNLDNESSLEFNASVNYKKNRFKIGAESSFFFIQDYIIGEIDPTVSPMTIGAFGVKVYAALDYATIWNSSLKAEYHFLNNFHLMGAVGYSLGQDDEGIYLPLIAPINYQGAIHYKKGVFDAEFSLSGMGEQKNFSPDYGEIPTDAYSIFNASASYNFYLGNNTLYLKGGVENIFDKYYSTYSDWNNIPRRGRNVFVNLSFVIK